jgi:predicted DNA-binding transcriptional regulator YafY
MSGDTTTSRLLRLLSLLQARRFWTGQELAERLGVSGRTLRRDIERLRTLGYQVAAQRGQVGGYRLSPGADLPPLMLSDEEAVTLAVSLRLAAVSGPMVGLAETSVSVLARLERVLPARLRDRVRALRTSTVLSTGPGEAAISADPDILVRLALACRDTQRVRLRYRARDGAHSTREVEPIALVPRFRRWYLVCWDLSRHDWRTLRVDRISHVGERGEPFAPRRLPAADAAEFVARQLGAEPVHTVDVVIDAPLEVTSEYLAGYARGLVDAGGGRTRWTISGARLEPLIGALAWLPWDYSVHGSAEFVALARQVAARISRAVGEPRDAATADTRADAGTSAAGPS